VILIERLSDMMKNYCEVIIDGPFDFMRGFVLGFLEGRGLQGEAIFGIEHHIENESKFGQLMRLIGAKEDRAALIVDCRLQEMIREAIEKRTLKNTLKIVSERELTEAYFKFSYHAYSRKLGNELKTLFGSLSPGIRIEKGRDPKETVNPEGKGIGAYAPLHEYEIEAAGEIHGPVKEVIDLYGEAEHKDMVELGEIELV
jgi:hypothetical protein